MFKPIDRALIHRYWTPERKKQLLGSKKLLLLPWEAPEVLVTMDLMNPEGSLTRSQTKKLLQVNHMLGLLRPTLQNLASQHPLLRIAEGACGNSYVSLLLAWYFTAVEPHPVMIIGTDSNPKVIAQSQERAAFLGLQKTLRFAICGLEDFRWLPLIAELFPEHVTAAKDPEESASDKERRLRPHLFVALHACDALSCRAIFHAMQLKADCLAIAPCCQAELAAQWKALSPAKDPPSVMRAIFSSPHLRRTTAADFTDTIRLLLMRSLGYDCEAIEFVPSEHTPKNRLLLAQRQRQYDLKSLRELEDFKTICGEETIELERLLEGQLEPYRTRLAEKPLI
ncbi:MAG: methyltransferase [Chitinophagaceae bacterium]|nr:methyltransferase [Oligoflexus sp.]